MEVLQNRNPSTISILNNLWVLLKYGSQCFNKLLNVFCYICVSTTHINNCNYYIVLHYFQIPIFVVGTKSDLMFEVRSGFYRRSSTIAEECGADEIFMVCTSSN